MPTNHRGRSKPEMGLRLRTLLAMETRKLTRETLLLPHLYQRQNRNNNITWNPKSGNSVRKTWSDNEFLNWGISSMKSLQKYKNEIILFSLNILFIPIIQTIVLLTLSSPRKSKWKADVREFFLWVQGPEPGYPKFPPRWQVITLFVRQTLLKFHP